MFKAETPQVVTINGRTINIYVNRMLAPDDAFLVYTDADGNPHVKRIA